MPISRTNKRSGSSHPSISKMKRHHGNHANTWRPAEKGKGRGSPSIYRRQTNSPTQMISAKKQTASHCRTTDREHEFHKIKPTERVIRQQNELEGRCQT